VDHLWQFAAKSVDLFSKYRVHNVGNARTDGRTDVRTLKPSGRKHYASSKSRLAKA